MHTLILALAVVALATGPLGCAAPRAVASTTPEQTAVMATVHQFIDGFNAGDTAKATAACTDNVCIIDDFPPHEWHGAGASSMWVSDYEVEAKKNGIADGFVMLRAPRHIDVTADRAYVVVPADYEYKLNGKPVDESDSMLTVALHKEGAGWRITGWAWSKH